ncbi:MAG: protein-disulfide reductase DsbD domain-containing protein [Ferrovibrio sp.]
MPGNAALAIDGPRDRLGTMIDPVRRLPPPVGAFLAAFLLIWHSADSLAQGLSLPHAPLKIALIQGSGDEAGLHIQLSPGWKFYWRTPGEGGVPAQFDWTGSENLKQVDVAWPAPKRILLGNTEIYGYGGEVVLPLHVERQQAGVPYTLDLKLEYGVCKDICILRNDRLHLSENASSNDNLILLAKWRARVPQPAAQVGLQLVSHRLKADRLVVSFESQVPLRSPDLFVEGASESWFGRPTVTMSENGREMRFDVPATYPPEKARQPLRLTLVDPALQAELVLPP